MQKGWLAAESPAFRDWIVRTGRWRVVTAGTTLYHAGDRADALFGLAAGALDVATPTESGEVVTFHRAEPGNWIGEAAILGASVRTLTVTPRRTAACSGCRLPPSYASSPKNPGTGRLFAGSA